MPTEGRKHDKPTHHQSKPKSGSIQKKPGKVVELAPHMKECKGYESIQIAMRMTIIKEA